MFTFVEIESAHGLSGDDLEGILGLDERAKIRRQSVIKQRWTIHDFPENRLMTRKHKMIKQISGVALKALVAVIMTQYLHRSNEK